jgi:hypothetical protein
MTPSIFEIIQNADENALRDIPARLVEEAMSQHFAPPPGVPMKEYINFIVNIDRFSAYTFYADMHYKDAIDLTVNEKNTALAYAVINKGLAMLMMCEATE